MHCATDFIYKIIYVKISLEFVYMTATEWSASEADQPKHSPSRAKLLTSSWINNDKTIQDNSYGF